MRLYAANGTPITVFGQSLHTLDLSLRRAFLWNFVIADVNSAIIGADFLSHYDLMVDLKQRCLVNKITNLRVKGIAANAREVSVKVFDSTSLMADLLLEFPHITTLQPVGTVRPSNITHRIETTGSPVCARTRRLAPDKYAAAKAEFEALMRLGVCRPSNSSWASPLHKEKRLTGLGVHAAITERLTRGRLPIDTHCLIYRILPFS
ncbi:uncharacterized protein LOC131291493 [Anopheles ziemanni]|uniref:uncharacterized protein LOC131291493 n=1 Tax=Anopheles ziemanni TaxID=345580 RepID=UPI00265EAA75|nr:uncharacterized protein LOC131291493 [Anopheles ziemanni]